MQVGVVLKNRLFSINIQIFHKEHVVYMTLKEFLSKILQN